MHGSKLVLVSIFRLPKFLSCARDSIPKNGKWRAIVSNEDDGLAIQSITISPINEPEKHVRVGLEAFGAFPGSDRCYEQHPPASQCLASTAMLTNKDPRYCRTTPAFHSTGTHATPNTVPSRLATSPCTHLETAQLKSHQRECNLSARKFPIPAQTAAF